MNSQDFALVNHIYAFVQTIVSHAVLHDTQCWIVTFHLLLFIVSPFINDEHIA